MKALEFIPENCVGCEVCINICSSLHGGETRDSASRIRVKSRFPDLPTPTFTPRACQHCDEPACVDACPAEALVLDKEAGQVRLIEDNCTGCGACVDACPYDSVWMDPLRDVAIKCDLCNGDPQCVKFCNFDAIRYTNGTG